MTTQPAEQTPVETELPEKPKKNVRRRFVEAWTTRTFQSLLRVMFGSAFIAFVPLAFLQGGIIPMITIGLVFSTIWYLLDAYGMHAYYGGTLSPIEKAKREGIAFIMGGSSVFSIFLSVLAYW